MKHVWQVWMATALIHSFGTATAEDARTLELDVEAQPLSAALREVAEEFEYTIAFYSDSTDGVEAPALAGTYTPAEALDTLLADTPLEYMYVNDSSVAVRRKSDASGEPAPGKTLPASSPVLMAQNQASAMRSASQEKGDGGDDEKEAMPIEEILVTGTNIRGFAPASPLLVMDREAIDLSGVGTVGELLELIPQNFGGTYNEDGGFINGFFGARFTGVSAVNLRGLGSASSLVLFNGRRLPSATSTSLVDVSMIPVSAIERVEVLTDGASAIYGSDAIAGVVNFIMSRDYEGAETRLRFGTVTKGDLREYRAVQSFGKNWDNSNLFVSYQYYNRGDLEALDRAFTADLAPETLSNRNEVDILSRLESHNFLLSGTHSFSDRFSAQGDILFSSRENNRESEFQGSPLIAAGQSDQYAAILAAFYEINESWELELAGVFGTNKNESQSFALPGRIPRGGVGEGENELWSIDAKVTGALFNLPAGQIDLAFGGQYREETLETSSVQNARQIRSLFAETLVPIVGTTSEVPGIRQLDLSLAVRHENYSDFGSTTDPKLGVIWSLTESLTLRGTWGTSFRAPSLDQLTVGPFDQTAFVFDFPDPSMPDGITTALLEQSFSNDQLGPEISTAYTMGFDYRPESIEGLDLSLTYFDVNFDDRIARPTESILTAFVDRDIFASQILVNPTAMQSADLVNRIIEEGFFQDGTGRPFDPAEIEAIFDNTLQNLSTTHVRGLDFSASYSFTSDVGNIELSVNGNYMFDFINQTTVDSPEDNAINTFLRPVDLRLRAGVSWRKDDLTAAVFTNYTDSYSNIVFVPPTKISSWTTVDLHISYDTGDRLDNYLDNTVIAFNVRNLFDQDPPSVGEGTALLGFGLARPVDYDPANASPLGRFISFELRKTF